MFVRHLCGCVSWRAKGMLPLCIYECTAKEHCSSTMEMTEEEERKFLSIVKDCVTIVTTYSKDFNAKLAGQ